MRNKETIKVTENTRKGINMKSISIEEMIAER